MRDGKARGRVPKATNLAIADHERHTAQIGSLRGLKRQPEHERSEADRHSR